MGNILTLKRKKDNALIDDLTFGYKNGNASNQLDHISDAAGSQNSSSVKEYQDLSTATSDEMAYDANGNMVKDLDRNIVTIKYNLLNLPEYIQFSNGNVIKNLYDAGGQKLRSDYYTYKQSLSEPLTDGEMMTPIYTPDNYDFSGTEYVGNIEYAISKVRGPIRVGKPMVYNDTYTFSRLYNAEGYAENLSSPIYYYFRKDHLGSNREVWMAPVSGSNGSMTVQRTQYYPSGLPWAESLGSSVQKKKYNGKEFVEMHGWDMYDYGARGYYPAIARWTNMDPMAEIDYSKSPYIYCNNNMINRYDPNGQWPAKCHNSMIDAAFEGVLSESEIQILKAASKTADNQKFQSSELSYRHAMGQEGLTNEESQQRYTTFIAKQVTKYANASNETDALIELGFALHAIMDNSSPSHQGFQVWHGYFKEKWFGLYHASLESEKAFNDPNNKLAIQNAILEMRKLLALAQEQKLKDNKTLLPEVVVTAEKPKMSIDKQINEMLWDSVRPNGYGNTGRYNKSGRTCDQYYSDYFLKWYYDRDESNPFPSNQ